MFSKAYRIASSFTLPVVISSRSNKGVCSSAIGACVVINRDGWILTTAHLIDEIQRQQNSVLKHRAHDSDVSKLEQDTVADKRFRKSKVRTFHRPQQGTVKNHSVWWGRDGAQLRESMLMPATDLALGRLEPFDPNTVAHYPTFKNPDHHYMPGTSLCKLGFPFHTITPSFDEQQNAFVLPPGSVPLPLFPIEGIFTRVVVMPAPNSTTEQGKFIETSSPGLSGQSGGPIVDTKGRIWALQSHTRHYPLGFSPPIPGQDKGQKQKEHQFLNVGLGIHMEPILHFLQNRGVAHQTSETDEFNP